MTESPHDKTVRVLEDKVRRQEGKLEELTRALYGYPELGQQGFRDQMLMEIKDLHEESANTKRLCQQIREERTAEAALRREEQVERRGKEQVISRTLTWVGGSSLFTLLSVILILITIWKGGAFGG